MRLCPCEFSFTAAPAVLYEPERHVRGGIDAETDSEHRVIEPSLRSLVVRAACCEDAAAVGVEGILDAEGDLKGG